MRALVALIAIVVILAIVGWLKFGSPNGDPTVQVDTDKVQKDTSAMVESVKDAANEIDKRVDVDIDADKKADKEPVDEQTD